MEVDPLMWVHQGEPVLLEMVKRLLVKQVFLIVLQMEVLVVLVPDEEDEDLEEEPQQMTNVMDKVEREVVILEEVRLRRVVKVVEVEVLIMPERINPILFEILEMDQLPSPSSKTLKYLKNLKKHHSRSVWCFFYGNITKIKNLDCTKK